MAAMKIPVPLFKKKNKSASFERGLEREKDGPSLQLAPNSNTATPAQPGLHGSVLPSLSQGQGGER